MIHLLKKRWILFLVLIVFIICKIPHLSYPYFWDESWPYAPAIKAMYNHGVSLMPSAVDGELSRGHPLFFHAVAAIWMNVFGPSHVSMHSFALFISVLFLITVFEVALKLFNERTAVISLLLVATQVLFFVQASLVLFEMLIALLAFLSLYFYVSKKLFLAGLCLTALFYTKESGLVMGLVLGADAMAGLFDKKALFSYRISKIAAVAIPVVLAGVFFLLQKHIRGWYILPLYSEIIEHSWKAFWYKFRMACVKSAFYDNIKYYYFLIPVVLSIVAAIKSKAPRYLIILLPAIIIYYFVNDLRAGRILPSIPFFILFVAAVFYFLYIFSSKQLFGEATQRKFIFLAGTFIFCFLCFSTMNFFTYRYLLAAIIPLMVVTAAFTDALLTRSYNVLYYPAIVAVLCISFFSFKLNDGYGDADMGAFTAMALQQSEVDFFEQNNYYDKAIGCGGFLQREHLTDPATGFLRSEKIFKHASWDITQHTDFAIFDNLEPDDRYSAIKKDTTFKLVVRYEKEKIWAEIYGRK